MCVERSAPRRALRGARCAGSPSRSVRSTCDAQRAGRRRRRAEDKKEEKCDKEDAKGREAREDEK